MSRRRRTIGAKRAREQAGSAGGEIAGSRTEHGLTITDASRRAGVSPETMRRVEAGDPGIQVDTLCAVGESVGIDIVIRTYRGRPPSLRDSGQLEFAEILQALAHPSWNPDLETRAGDHGEAADIGFFGPMEIIDAEIDRQLRDFQDQLRRNLRKRDWLAARHQRPVRLVMVVEDTKRNRAAIEPHGAFIKTVLPAGSREVLNALRAGTPLGRDGLLWIRRRHPPRR